jgi:hypothetical protein
MGAICTNQPIQLPDYKETVTGTQLPAYVAAGGKELYEQARELSKSEFPQYEGERIATYGTDEEGNPFRMSETERSGLDLLATGDTAYKDILDDAKEMAGTLGQGFTGATTETLLGDPFSADTVNQYMDTFQTSIDPAIEELSRQRDLQQRQNSADAIRAGAFGGSRLGIREGLTDAEMARAGADLRRQAGREALQFASGRYDTDREARFAADQAQRAGFETDEASRLRASETLSGLAPLAQGLQEQAASGMITAGQAERELDQRALDLAYQDYLQQQQYPFEMLNFAMGALQGLPYETLTRAQATGNQFMQQPSIYGQTLGGLGSLASLYALSRRT